jgi:hypothetical protein
MLNWPVLSAKRSHRILDLRRQELTAVIVGLAEDDVPIARIMRRTSHGRRAVRRNGTGFWRHMTCKGCRGRLSTGDLLAFLASAMRRRIVIGAEDTIPEPGQDTEVLVGIAMVVKRV